MKEKTLRFDLRSWNDAYGELMDEDDSLDFYKTTYEDEIPAKELKKHLASLEAWTDYAYNNKLLIELTAFLEPNDQVYASICLNSGNAIVRFVDEHNRIYMVYSFGGEYKKGQLFLDKLQYFIYPDDEAYYDRDESVKDVTYEFTPEGGLRVITEELRDDGHRYEKVEEAAHPVNVSANWEPYPEPGKYESLARLRRWGNGDLLKGIDPNQPPPRQGPGGDAPQGPQEQAGPYTKWLPDNWDEVRGN